MLNVQIIVTSALKNNLNQEFFHHLLAKWLKEMLSHLKTIPGLPYPKILIDQKEESSLEDPNVLSFVKSVKENKTLKTI